MIRACVIPFIILIVLSPIQGIAQSEVQRVKLNDSLGSREYYFGLVPVENSEYTVHYRYEYIQQVIDVYSHDGINFEGQMLCWVYGDRKKVKKDWGHDMELTGIYYTYSDLDSGLSRQFAELFQNKYFFFSDSIKAFPTSEQMTEANRVVMDCYTAHFWKKENSKSEEIHFHCPNSWIDWTDRAKKVKLAEEEIDSIFGLKHMFDSLLMSKLDKGKSYKRGMFNTAIFKKMPKRKQRIVSHLHGLEDTINFVIEDHINKKIAEDSAADFICYGGIDVKFSKKGRIKNCRNKEQNWIERSVDPDWWICKKRMKALLKDFRCSELEIKHSFTRHIWFWSGEFSVQRRRLI